MARKARIPSYRRHSVRDFGFVEHLGKRIRLPGRFNSAESRAAYAVIVAQLRAGEEPAVPLAPTEVAVADVVQHALDEAARRYVRDGRPTQEYGHLRAIADVLLATCADVPAVEFGPRALKAVREKMVARGWGRQQTNRQVGRLIRMFRWAAADELIPATIPVALREIEPLRQGRTTAPESPPSTLWRRTPWTPPFPGSGPWSAR